MPQTEAQKRASKKWAETHREENIKRISECIKKRYDTDEEFRTRKQETERERQRAKKAVKEAARLAAVAETEAEPTVALSDTLFLAKMEKTQQPQKTVVYGF
jgi:hypothetical protein